MRTARRLAVLSGLLALLSAAPLRPAGAFRVHIAEDDLARAVGRAVRGASARLAQPTCASVLGDFSDRDGRPLRARLADLGVEAPAYLEWILFTDGALARRCATAGVHAVSASGVRVVFVCRRFGEMARRDAASAEAAIIHEALHTLGLGEDPPTSEAITSRVRERCVGP